MAHINAGPTGPGSRRYRPRRGQEWQVSPASIAAQLKARGLLPALQGYKVVFSDLGIDIPGPQPAPWLPEDRILVCYWLLGRCANIGPALSHLPQPVRTIGMWWTCPTVPLTVTTARSTASFSLG